MYLLFKSLHIISAILFLGNVITGIFWKSLGDRTGDPAIMAYTLDGIIRSGRLFTVPGVLGILVFGLAGTFAGGLPILASDWIWKSLILLAISGVIFSARVAPLQSRLRGLARAAADGGAWDPEAYRRTSREWEMWRSAAIAAPLVALWLMVSK